MGSRETDTTPFGADLFAVAYRPVDREGRPSLDIWQETLALGAALPTLPLWLPGAVNVPIALEASYERTCRELRITDAIASARWASGKFVRLRCGDVTPRWSLKSTFTRGYH